MDGIGEGVERKGGEKGWREDENGRGIWREEVERRDGKKRWREEENGLRKEEEKGKREAVKEMVERRNENG